MSLVCLQPSPYPVRVMTARSANVIADAILAKAASRGILMSNLKLQKLLYYVQGFHLTKRGGEAFFDAIKAWPHGPVVPVVYHRFKGFSWHEIEPVPALPSLPEKTSELIDKVLDRLGLLSGVQLEDMTHAEPPWISARGKDPLGSPVAPTIPIAKMRAHFSGLSLN